MSDEATPINFNDMTESVIDDASKIDDTATTLYTDDKKFVTSPMLMPPPSAIPKHFLKVPSKPKNHGLTSSKHFLGQSSVGVKGNDTDIEHNHNNMFTVA